MSDQPNLFDQEPDWSEHWQGMPEFTQEKQKPFKELIMRFDNEEDYQEFAEMIGQKLTMKTKSAWHPTLQRGKFSHLFYQGVEDES